VLRRSRVQVGVRGVPTSLEPVEQVLLDLRGDVGVRLDDPVLEVVPELAGLGDLWDPTAGPSSRP
jgi:hypothetical protein